MYVYLFEIVALVTQMVFGVLNPVKRILSISQQGGRRGTGVARAVRD